MAVDTVDVSLSELVDLAGFDGQDIRLTRDGVDVALDNTVTVSLVSDSAPYLGPWRLHP